MYWPCGVPKIYAYDVSKSRPVRDDALEFQDKNHNGTPSEEVEGTLNTPTDTNEKTKSEDWYSKGIIDLKASRNDQVFVTITKSNIAVWQSRV